MSSWADKKERTNTAEDIDITDVTPLSEVVRERTPDRGLVKERHAGTVARLVVVAFVSLLILPLAGGMIATFASVAQAQAFVTSVIALLEALAKFISQVFLPILTAVFGYYFIQERKSK